MNNQYQYLFSYSDEGTDPMLYHEYDLYEEEFLDQDIPDDSM